MIIFLVLSCVSGFFVKIKKSEKKSDNINYSLRGLSTCSGIILARVLAHFINQELLMSFALLSGEFLMAFFAFFIGINLRKLKTISTSKCE